ncbi:hypothetical protein [Pseudomonas syringae]|nr:hypothetical protein [Pseudomonas syringae]
MERFTNSLRSSVDNQNWYVALSSALTLPDVCGRLVEPNEKSSERRYSNWFTAWMEPAYTYDLLGRPGHVFLTGGDCYALRCSYLHEGGADISAQRARKALDSFHFISPPTNGFIIHCNEMHGVLQLQVDIFCRQVADAVDRWATSVGSDEVIQERMKSLLTIHTNVPGLMDYDWG